MENFPTLLEDSPENSSVKETRKDELEELKINPTDISQTEKAPKSPKISQEDIIGELTSKVDSLQKELKIVNARSIRTDAELQELKNEIDELFEIRDELRSIRYNGGGINEDGVAW